MSLSASKLRDRCRIEYRQPSQDPTYGTEVGTWAALATLWCEWQDELPSKSESVKPGLQVASSRARVRLRYRGDITSAMRVVRIVGVVETVYQIIGGPATLGKREGIELFVEVYST